MGIYSLQGVVEPCFLGDRHDEYVVVLWGVARFGTSCVVWRGRLGAGQVWGRLNAL